jgi:hypothetical protein
MLLRCNLRDIADAEGLAMSRLGAPTCRTELPDGTTRALEVR